MLDQTTNRPYCPSFRANETTPITYALKPFTIIMVSNHVYSQFIFTRKDLRHQILLLAVNS